MIDLPFNKEYRKKSDELWDEFFEPLIKSVKKETQQSQESVK